MRRNEEEKKMKKGRIGKMEKRRRNKVKRDGKK